MTKTVKHVEKAWAIRMENIHGGTFLLSSTGRHEFSCFFRTRRDAKARLRLWKSELDKWKPVVVRVEIREL